jgi:hypothetical protein
MREDRSGPILAIMGMLLDVAETVLGWNLYLMLLLEDPHTCRVIEAG